MRMRGCPAGFTVVELLLVLMVLIILGFVFLPPLIWYRSREHSPQGTCFSQIRQLATAIQMYAEDHHGRFPSANWVADTETYVGSLKIYHCPADKESHAQTPISYAYNRQLLGADGRGINEECVKAPTEVGTVCDAGPTREGIGGLISGGTLRDPSLASKPVAHHKGVIVGFCDGHAKHCVGKPLHERDVDSQVVRAFYQAGALRLLENPAGSILPFRVTASNPAPLAVGGEACTSLLLHAAAKGWQVQTGAPFRVEFAGQYAAKPKHGASVWGCADGEMPKGPAVAIARDAVVVIVSRNTKLFTVPAVQPFARKTGGRDLDSEWAISEAGVRTLFGAQTGVRASTFVGYTYNLNSGTRRFFTRYFGESGQPMPIGKRALVVRDDWEMVDRVFADPYGIGYCSSAMVDLDLVSVLGLLMPDGKVQAFYQRVKGAKSSYRQLPDEPTWPLTRTLYARVGGQAWDARGRAAFGNQMLAPGSPGRQALEAGPLFMASYWRAR